MRLSKFGLAALCTLFTTCTSIPTGLNSSASLDSPDDDHKYQKWCTDPSHSNVDHCCQQMLPAGEYWSGWFQTSAVGHNNVYGCVAYNDNRISIYAWQGAGCTNDCGTYCYECG